jgi:SUKH-4 immunity protein
MEDKNMTYEQYPNWPRFEVATMPLPPDILHHENIPGMTLSIPKAMLGYYHITDEIAVLENPLCGQLLCFGKSLASSNICFVSQTGQIVQDLLPENYPILFVSSSLEQFTDCIRAVYERFPFDSWRPDNPLDMFDDFDRLQSEWESASKDLAKTFERIDPMAWDPDGFWGTFVHDVYIGDYATKDMLEDD